MKFSSVRKIALNAVKKAKIHSPELLIGGGIIAVVGAFVGVAIAATKNSSDIHEDVDTIKVSQKTINDYRKAKDDADLEQEQLDKADEVLQLAKKQKAKALLRLIRNVLITYGIPICVEALGVWLIFYGHSITRKRLAAAIATSASLAGAGKDIIERTKALEKEGEKKPTERVRSSDGSVFILFDELNPNWSKDYKSNIDFLRALENNLNASGEEDGYIELNDILKIFGYSPKKELLGVGKYIGNRFRSLTDTPYIDFGLRRSNEKVRDFLNGTEKAIWIEIKHDGYIYDVIGGEDIYEVHSVSCDPVNDDIPRW